MQGESQTCLENAGAADGSPELPSVWGPQVRGNVLNTLKQGCLQSEVIVHLQTGLVAFTWGFWTWFTDGVCTPAVVATKDYVSSKWTAMCVR